MTDADGRPAGAAERAALPGVAVAAVGLVVGAGLAGGLGAAVLVASWALAPPVAVAAIGAFVVVAAGGPPASAALAGVGLGAVLLAPLARASAAPLEAVGAVLAVGALFGGATWIAVGATSLSGAAVVLLGVAGVAAYAVHRYGLVVTGAVDAEVATDG